MGLGRLLSHLRTNTTINVDILTPIVEDVQNYDIRDLKFMTQVTDLKDITKTRHENAENSLVDIRFINYISDEDTDFHELHARMSVMFMRGRKTYRMELFGTISATYKEDLYIIKLQEYLYTFMAKSIETNEEFKKFREIRFPDTLSSFYRGSFSWKHVDLMDFTWIDRDETPTIAKITNGLLDKRSFYDVKEPEENDGSNLVIPVTYGGPDLTSSNINKI